MTITYAHINTMTKKLRQKLSLKEKKNLPAGSILLFFHEHATIWRLVQSVLCDLAQPHLCTQSQD